MILSYKYRLYPTPAQEKRLQFFLDITRNVYNMALGERKCVYELEGRSVSKFEQQLWIKYYRKCVPHADEIPVVVYRQATIDLDLAFKSFFRRVKAGEAPGFPKFKGFRFWDSFGYAEKVGFKVEKNRLNLRNIGRVRIKFHRPLPSEPKTLRIKRKNQKWYATFTVEVEEETKPHTQKQIGIDVGLSSLFTTSDGYHEPHPQFYRNSQRELRLVQRKWARAKKYSGNWQRLKQQVNRLQEHTANQRKWYIENLVNDLIENYDLIAVEDLRIKNMVKNKHLSKSILDSGWGMFVEKLQTKAKQHGRTVILVNPAYTSKACSNCGKHFENFKLSTRWVECECGLSMDRDENAAINILNRGLEQPISFN